MPWMLQIRSFSELVTRHKFTRNLVPSAIAVKMKENVTDHCEAYGLVVAGTWWNINPTHLVEHPTHYYVSDNPADDGVLCHYVMPQYNIHGTYHIQKQKIAPVFTAPSSCGNDSYAAIYYYYHGSIGYYSFYEEGEGSYCTKDQTVYLISTGVGSSDINFWSLANFERDTGNRVSFVFGFLGSVWIEYRAVVLTRSFDSCSRYGRRLDGLQEPISLSNAAMFIQQASHIAPHDANNWHRIALLYLLVEGLMADLFLPIAREGYAAKVQYISLGYNIAG